MGLQRPTLLEIRDLAVSSGANATPFHAANAAGTFSYQDGTWALRDRHVKAGGEWEVDRLYGVEAIKNEARKLKIVFANVDIACDDIQKPQPRTKRGAGGERTFNGNLNLFGTLPEYAPAQAGGFSAFYLMVDEKGAVELTQPVIKGGKFSTYVERIYLSDGTDLILDKPVVDDSDRADNFDPLVVRKP
jgi:hypothetical protein